MKKKRIRPPGQEWLQIDKFRKDPIAVELFITSRRLRPSILAPWHGECLILRAGDRRLVARESWKPQDRPFEDWLKKVAPGQKVKLPGHRRRILIAAEEILLDAAAIRRACSWPELPQDCSIDQAAELLGVSRSLISCWIKRKLLVGRKFSCRRNRPSFVVAYRQHLKTFQRELGVYEYPDPAAKRIFCSEPDLAWAVERFDREIHVQNLVRLVERQGGPEGKIPRPLWICPACGSQSFRLYLPAGPMAKAGHLQGHWRFQCGRCFGVRSEQMDWNNRRNNGFNRNLLKMSCGKVSASEFKRGLRLTRT